jgi:hypothetical protein
MMKTKKLSPTAAVLADALHLGADVLVVAGPRSSQWNQIETAILSLLFRLGQERKGGR